MNQIYVDSKLEFLEVLNEFPILDKTFKELDLKVKDFKNGENIHCFFQRKGILENEEKLILRKLNENINIFLKTGNIPEKKQIIISNSLLSK